MKIDDEKRERFRNAVNEMAAGLWSNLEERDNTPAILEAYNILENALYDEMEKPECQTK